MRRDFHAYLSDVLKAAEDIEWYTLGIDKDVFAALGEKQAAVERKFEIIGEAIVQCRQHYPAEIAKLGDVQSVIDFRNYLAHRYNAVSYEIVWDILVNDLPVLRTKVKALLVP